MNIQHLSTKIFSITSPGSFNETALELFRYQYQTNKVYRTFTDQLRIRPGDVKTVEQIPFLPVEFFKTQVVYSGNKMPQHWFESSGTSGMIPSKHYYSDLSLYEESFMGAFREFYGNADEYCILALLPSYLERQGSSLVYMAGKLIESSRHPESGFYLENRDELAKTIVRLDNEGQKIMLIGVSYALLDLIENHKFHLKNTIIVETGGMKGRKRELVREELHQLLCSGFGVGKIHAEYGMTELFSQAWSKGEGSFVGPSWLRVLIRDVNDPLTIIGKNAVGGINIIDLANLGSCCFIATQDLGRLHEDGSFEVLGRFDQAELRGCNLLVAH
ncbi:MAG: acyl transferase [Bacteroidales bacterium]|nr:acyl transferase [Bacteroidales bacterium]